MSIQQCEEAETTLTKTLVIFIIIRIVMFSNYDGFASGTE